MLLKGESVGFRDEGISRGFGNWGEAVWVWGLLGCWGFRLGYFLCLILFPKVFAFFLDLLIFFFNLFDMK